MQTKRADRAAIFLLIVMGVMLAFYQGAITLDRCNLECERMHEEVISGEGVSPWVYRLLTPLFVEGVERLVFAAGAQ
jgi:hypothetical protein